MKYKILFVPVAMGVVIQSGEYNRPIAIEKWSTPEEITVFRENNYHPNHPSVSANGHIIYYEGIGFIRKTKDGWTTPQLLGQQISKNLARKPCISPDGKRLFFSWWLGGWILYYSDWDENIGDWGTPVNCGPTINNELGGPYAENMPNDTTLILTYGPVIFISHWDKYQQIWKYPQPFAVEYLALTTTFGTWVSSTFDRVYGSSIIIDTTREGESYTNYYFDVVYRDSTNPGQYTPPYILNICFESDSLYLSGEYEGRFEAWPTFTADGRTMYFIADYHGYLTLFETHLIIDEHGDSIKTEIKLPEPDTSNTMIPEIFILNMPYPNPFNSRITIEYELPESAQINLSVYDLTGRLVTTLKDGFLPAGYYSEVFEGSGNASGIYFILLKSDNLGIQTKKILLLK